MKVSLLTINFILKIARMRILAETVTERTVTCAVQAAEALPCFKVSKTNSQH